MDKIKESEISILGHATAIVERMRERGASLSPPAVSIENPTETALEKTRRIQRALDDANRIKVTGTTQADINRQEGDRKALTKLIIANSQLENGNFSSVTVESPNDDPPVKPRGKARKLQQ